MKGHIHSIETLAAVDGPGLRMAIFMQGCPQRCIYCHNPDTWCMTDGEIADTETLAAKAERYKPYFKHNGGVTISGGEPFMQIDFTLELLKKLKERSIHTAVDTCGYYLNDKVREALRYTDLVLLDIKHSEESIFSVITKADIKKPVAFLNYLKQIQKPIWIRQVVVPGYTDTKEQINAMLDMIDGARVERVDLLPYHTLGVDKWTALNIPYELNGVEPPNTEVMDMLNSEVLKRYPNNKKI